MMQEKVFYKTVHCNCYKNIFSLTIFLSQERERVSMVQNGDFSGVGGIMSIHHGIALEILHLSIRKLTRKKSGIVSY